MAHFLHSTHSFLFRKSDQLFLALSWLLGLGCGGVLFCYAGSNLVSLMPLAANCQPSIIGLLTSFGFPFLLSVFAVYLNVPRVLYGICFLKALLIGYFSCGVFAVFGSAGWLVRCMLLCTDYFGAVLLYHFWHRHISGWRGIYVLAAGGYSGAFLLLAGMDYFYISPLLRHVLL